MERRIRHKQEVVDEGKRLVIEYLSEDRFFQSKIDKLANQYREMEHMPMMQYPFPVEEHAHDLAHIYLKSLPADTVSNIANIDTTRIEEYSYALHELALSVNLRCDWAVEELHNLIKATLISLRTAEPTKPSEHILSSTMWASKTIDRLKLDIPIRPETRKVDIDKIVNKEWRRIRNKHPELQKRMKFPPKFELKIKWLCRRLVLGYTGEGIKRLFEDSKYYDDEYIDLSRRQTARLLGIKLPIGRPPKPKKR